MKTIALLALTIILLSTRFAVAQYTPADAKDHIGQTLTIEGYLYKAELHKVKKDSVLILNYYSDAHFTKPMFIEVIGLRIKKVKGVMYGLYDNWNVTKHIKAYLSPTKPEKTQPPFFGAPESSVTGKIVMFNGLPAIITEVKNITIVEDVY